MKHTCKQFEHHTKDNEFECVECGTLHVLKYTGTLGSHKLVNGRLKETTWHDRPYILEKKGGS